MLTPTQLHNQLASALQDEEPGEGTKEAFAAELGRLDDSPPLSLYTVYDSPADYPGRHVVRRWENECGDVQPREVLGTALSLDEARTLLPPGLFNLGRKESDDRCIVETWI